MPHGSDWQQGRRNSGLGSAVVFVVLLLTMGQLLLFQLEPGAPMWAVPAGTLTEQKALVRMEHLDAQFAAAAAGKNLELKLIGFDPENERQAVMVGAIYYRGNYALYPRRVWVGRDGVVVNSAEDIIRADIVPPDSWLRSHDVGNVEAMIFSPDAPLGTMIRPVR